MEEIVQLAYSRGAYVITPATEGLPAAQSKSDANGKPVNPTGDGLFETSDTFDSQLSIAAGTARTVLVIPAAKDAPTTWTLTVYGMRLIGDTWRAIVLYQASCVCDVPLTGDTDDELDNNDYMASDIIPTSTFPEGAAEVTTLSSTAYPAHVLVNTRGCPFLVFTGSDTASRACVANVS